MNGNQLRVFHAVARCGSFSVAASQLALTQPAVSDHIRKLEDAYGTRLFTRGPKGAQLTEVGRKLLLIAERHAEAEDEADMLLSRVGSLEEGSLSIGADAAIHILPAVRHFRERHPGVALRLEGGNSASLISRLRSFNIDLAVVAQVPLRDDLESLLLRRDRLVVIAPSDWAATLTSSGVAKGLAGRAIVLREDGSVTRELSLKVFQELGNPATAVMEVSGRETCLEAVAQGMGAAIISAGEVPNDRRLTVLPIPGKAIFMEEHLVYLRTRRKLRVMRAFLESVRASGSAADTA